MQTRPFLVLFFALYSPAILAQDRIPGLAVREVPAAEGDVKPVHTFFENDEGIYLKGAPLNEVFQYLASQASKQFFHNTTITGPQYFVTGQLLNKADPINQMEELGLMYGVTVHTKGNTVYALTSAQESILPGKTMHYQMRYLRASDIEKIKLILQPFLTPGTGIVEYESKTNSIVIYDNDRKSKQLRELLQKLDQPKQQVAIETRILRVTSDTKNRMGVDWATILGAPGFPLDAVANLNNLFNLPDLHTVNQVLTVAGGAGNTTRTINQITAQNYSGSFLVLNPAQMNAVMQALNVGNLAQQESSPTLIAEDNEDALISIVDRFPIIVSTISQTQVSQNTTEEVRYRIDPEDPVGDPTTSREVGVSMAVTPTILPDDTIRMKLRPRTAQITEFISSPSGNLYPRVNESTVTTMARVPNGHSLLIGGFYEEIETDNSRKVPIFGDVPGFNFLFKNDHKTKVHTSLVFVVTPMLYRPGDVCESDAVAEELLDLHVLPVDHNYPDRERPRFNHRRSWKDTWSGIKKERQPDPYSSPLLPPDSPPLPPIARPSQGQNYLPQQGQPNIPQVEVNPVVNPVQQKMNPFKGLNPFRGLFRRNR